MAHTVPGSARGAIGFATRKGVATEQRMLGLEAGGRTCFAPHAGRIIGAAVARSAEHGHA